MSFPEYPLGVGKEQRQNINISMYAYTIMRSDMSRFNVEAESSFINTIIKLYAPIAKANITYTINNTDWADIFGSQGPSESEKNKYCKKYADQKLEELERYPKDKQLKISIDNETATYLTGTSNSKRIITTELCEEDRYYVDKNGKGRKDKFIKAVVEEFVRLSEYEREKIYFKDIIDSINKAKTNNRILEITTGGAVYQVTDYFLTADFEQRYSYLVGYSKNKSDINQTPKPYPFRISRIEKVGISPSPYKFDSYKMDILQELINERGASYIAFEPEEIKISLTPKGQKMYEQIIAQRPLVNKIDKESGIYTFHCTKLQIEHYFLKFGADAIILEPEDLRKKFQEHYRNALEKYTD